MKKRDLLTFALDTRNPDSLISISIGGTFNFRFDALSLHFSYSSLDQSSLQLTLILSTIIPCTAVY